MWLLAIYTNDEYVVGACIGDDDVEDEVTWE